MVAEEDVDTGVNDSDLARDLEADVVAVEPVVNIVEIADDEALLEAAAGEVDETMAAAAAAALRMLDMF